MRLITIYKLSNDAERIASVQRATVTTRKFGFMRTYGLFGSEQWWRSLHEGKLRSNRISGTIVQIRNHDPREMHEVMLRTLAARESEWLMYADSASLAKKYSIGRYIEIDYVLLRSRLFSDGWWPARTPVVIEVRIEDEEKVSRVGEAGL